MVPGLQEPLAQAEVAMVAMVAPAVPAAVVERLVLAAPHMMALLRPQAVAAAGRQDPGSRQRCSEP